MSDYFKNSSLENTAILIVYPFYDFLSEAYNFGYYATNSHVSNLSFLNTSSHMYIGELSW